MCVSIRRRPITSPPGGGTVARPQRASNGPASRIEARISRHRSSSSSVVAISAAWTRTSLGPTHSASAPTWRSSAIIVSTSLILGTFSSVTGWSVSRQAARIGSAAFLFPAARTLPERRAPPSITNDCLSASATTICTAAKYPTQPVEPTREQAWETLTQYTKSEPLIRHALGVEACMGWYAGSFDEDEELWRVVGLLHDFDYEIHPTLDKHPQDGAPILRELGYPEVVVEAVLSHAEHLSMPRDTPLKKTLFACDELSGFVTACCFVRPDGIATLEPRSVKKKLKQPSFAAGVHRDEVYAGAELLGLDLDQHIANVIEAMRGSAAELGLERSA